MAFVFAVDIGGTSGKLGLFNEEKRMLYQSHFPTGKGKSIKEVFNSLNGEMEKALDFLQLSKEDLSGIGIGLPGPVTERKKVHGCVNLSWGNFDAVKDLEKIWQVPIAVENDANMAALGEIWKGDAASYHSFVFLTLGTGIGAGIFHNDSLVRGARGGAGEVGHMPIFRDRESGEVKEFESCFSSAAIVRLAKEKLAEDYRESPLREIEIRGELTPKTIFQKSQLGDPIAQEIAEEAADYLGQGLACIADLYDPQLFILGGGLSLAGDSLLKPCTEAFKKYVFPPLKDTPIRLSRLGERAGIFGAAFYIFSYLSIRSNKC